MAGIDYRKYALDREHKLQAKRYENLTRKVRDSYKSRSSSMDWLDKGFDIMKLIPDPTIQSIAYAGDVGMNLFDDREYSMPKNGYDDLYYYDDNLIDLDDDINAWNQNIEKQKLTDVGQSLLEFAFTKAGKKLFKNLFGEEASKLDLSTATTDTTKASNIKFNPKMPSIGNADELNRVPYKIGNK